MNIYEYLLFDIDLTLIAIYDCIYNKLSSGVGVWLCNL